MFPRSQSSVQYAADSGDPSDDALYRGKWHAGYGVMVVNDTWWPEEQYDAGLVYFRSGLTRRTANNPFDGECLSFVEAADVALSVALLLEEFEFGIRPTMWEKKLAQLDGVDVETDECKVPVEGHTDSEGLTKAIRSLTWGAKGKRRKGDIFDLQELEELGIARATSHVDGTTNPFDSGTKRMSFESVSMQRLREVMAGSYEPVFGRREREQAIEWVLSRSTDY